MNMIARLVQRAKEREVLHKLNGYRDIAATINKQDLRAWNDEQLKAESLRLQSEAKAGTPLDKLLTDAYALVCEAAQRTLGMRPFEVQVMAAIALHEGKLVEMQTGEGKTLAAVMPAYLNAITGKGVHVLTFNDYLANRDAEWMGPVYRLLGLSVGAVQSGMSLAEKQQAYSADITYVTAKEAGFDYLRDSIAMTTGDTVHRAFHYVIVDEADSLLLDEARIPLVIADEAATAGQDGTRFADVAKQLHLDEHFIFDEFKRNVFLTEAGSDKVESLLNCGNLYEAHNVHLLTSIHCALHADALLQRDIDYIVRDGRIELIDEYTGRVAENRHLPEGLQAALEAKEGLASKVGGTILGTITLQHLLRLYPTISGMTATAQASADEFDYVYSLQVVRIPPNRPCIRIDHPHQIYTRKEAKLRALVDEIASVHATGRPILIGTSSVQESDILADRLREVGVSYHVLNAKNDSEEAEIIARAGEIGAVTVSTNMAGRGVDIRLGGGDAKQADAVVELGGLYIIGTLVNESVRIDNQLRGRAGRQGDPGASRFFVSLEDDLLLHRSGIDQAIPSSYRKLRQDEPLDKPALRNKIGHVQRVIMGQNFQIRQELNRYSDMVEEQRLILYKDRLAILTGEMPMSPSEQRVRLFYIDKLWAEHLAYVSYIREGIHLESLADLNPIDEFHARIIKAFGRIQAKIEKETSRMLERLSDSNDPSEWERLGLKGPSSTRTYIINDHYTQRLTSLVEVAVLKMVRKVKHAIGHESS
ncbi:accessory Sec system translocase SecA2 [Paenibacillus kobensis]|uniref:accessory Sec system translocase SecA2 n=1 Tax=Paenibacillus kobensis TaxID=59841 RepID=UPI000FD8F415|nr:accessory Sec system translocase SecA2 [Paenibacillus kobensis]